VSLRGEVALVVNPTAGRGRGAELVAPVVERLRTRGVSARVVTGADAAEAAELCRKAVADGVEALVSLGGDGMAHTALQAVAGTETPLAIIPAGTGNDLAVSTGLPADPLAAADLVAEGEVRALDAVLSPAGDGLGGDVWWACVLGAGFDAAVTERANRMRWPRGPRRYDLAILAELRVFRPHPFVLELDGVRVEHEAVFVAVGNGPSYGAGMRIAPDARLDDGLLDVTVVGAMSRRELVRMFPTVYKGTHVTHPAVSRHRARIVTLASPGQLAYVDGERLGQLPTCAECHPGALRLLSPPRLI
jgi:diacylglycerol kinase (ATP)